MFFLVEVFFNRVGIDSINLVGSKTTQMTGKNIIWPKINIQDNIFYINIEMKTCWINSNQPWLIF